MSMIGMIVCAIRACGMMKKIGDVRMLGKQPGTL